MPRLSWVIPCVHATVDRFTNAVSLVNVVEELRFPASTPEPDPAKPLHAPGLIVVSHWTRNDSAKPEKARAKLVFLGPRSKKPLGQSEFDIDLSTFMRARQLSHLQAFPYVGPGSYFIEVHLQSGTKWRRLSRTWIEVKKETAANAPVEAH